MTTQCLYVSRCAPALTSKDLQILLATSKMLNRRVDVTGVLAYSGDYFAQIVEGAPDVVDALLARIARDARHVDPSVLLLLRDRPKRMFGEWSMEVFEASSLNELMRQAHENHSDPLTDEAGELALKLRDHIVRVVQEVHGSSTQVDPARFRVRFERH